MRTDGGMEGATGKDTGGRQALPPLAETCGGGRKCRTAFHCLSVLSFRMIFKSRHLFIPSNPGSLWLQNVLRQNLGALFLPRLSPPRSQSYRAG